MKNIMRSVNPESMDDLITNVGKLSVHHVLATTKSTPYTVREKKWDTRTK